MGWGFGRIEQRVAVPDVQHVVQSQVRMLEQVSCLPIDLERLGIIERVEVEQITHRKSVLQATTRCRVVLRGHFLSGCRLVLALAATLITWILRLRIRSASLTGGGLSAEFSKDEVQRRWPGADAGHRKQSPTHRPFGDGSGSDAGGARRERQSGEESHGTE